MKRLLTILLTLVLLVGAVSLSVSAVSLADQTPGQAAKAMTFPTDGSNHVAVCPVCGKEVTWYPLTAATVSAGKSLTKNYHYYLAEDVDTTRSDGPLISAASSTGNRCCLHLNGKKLINRGNVALQGGVSRFNIMGDGIVQGAKTGAEEGATIQINPGMDYGAVVLYGGTYSKVNPGTTANVAAARGNGGKIELHDGATIVAGTAGSAVYLNGEMTFVSASFTMFGGTLDASATSELAVDMEKDAVKKANKVEFHMAGGTLISGAAGAVTVRDTTAVYMTGGTIRSGHINIEANGKMEISGGTITGGSATNGGNIYVAPGAQLTMTGGTIEKGTATGNGGNVYIDEDAVFNMSGGKITSGNAVNGGNVYLGYTGDTIENQPARFNMTGGSLESGNASSEGGNLYVLGINSKNSLVYMKNATIKGGTAKSNGGNITVNRSTLTMEDGAEILNGTSTGARAGNIRLYIGKIIMKGGRIAGGSAKTAATDNIWAYGVSNAFPGSFYMLGGVIAPATDRHNAGVSLAAYGRLYLANDATFTNVDPSCAAVAVGSSGGNYGKLFICDGWTGFADVYVLDKGYAVGAEVSNSYVQIVKLKDDLSTTVGGTFTGTLVQLYEGNGQFIPGAASGKLTVANSVLVAENGKLTATADPLTDWAAGSYAYLKLNADLTLEDLGGLELTVDLNGYDLQVGGSGKVHAFDSQNDNYSAVLCGAITAGGDVTVSQEVIAPNGNRYVAVTESGKITMHRLDMYMTAVTLRTSAAGLYYKATYKCDKVLEQAVTAYGVVLSVNNMPGADFATETGDINRYTVSTTGFKSGMTVTSGSVFGIMKDDRQAANNDAYGKVRIYANPYVKLDTDAVFVGDTENAGKTADSEDFDGVAYSLHDALDTVDSIFFDYDLTDRNQFASFYNTWKDKGMGWDFDNISDEPTGIDNSDLKFTSGTNAYCPVCKKTVTWTALTQAAYGTTRLVMSAGGHYYLAEDITYTGADAAAIRGPSGTTPACLHLNGHDLVATNEGAIIGYTGVMNVLGNGTVMGNATAETTGAAVNINTSGANGKVNLYGGIYTLPQANETAPAVGVANNGGEINIYEGVTVRGAGGYSVYMGEANLTNAKLGIYGAKIEGTVTCAEPSDSKARSCILEIGGNAQIDKVMTRSMYIQDRLSGAPKIGLMAMVANTAMELDGLSEGTAITVNTRGTLSAPSDRIEEYKKYFTTFTDTHSLKVVNNALQYEIDFEAYMTPFIRDVSAEAIADGKIHYYFMSTEGFVTSPTAADNIYKWGDSCLIVFPNGETMLVDTGYSMQQPWLIGNLKRMGVGSEENPLDYLLITHPHSDHQGAFYSPYPFFDEIKVTQVYHNKLRVDSASTDEYVENVCNARNLPLTDLKQGMEMDFGDVHMEVLWPAPAMATTNIGTGKINDNSLVFRLDYGEHSALFTGDIYTLAEGQILDSVDNEKLKVDFLKIPHHGWNTSSSAEFVKAVSAKLAVATSFLEMEESIRRNYVSAKTEVLLDVYDGYIHVSAGADDTMTYETSR